MTTLSEAASASSLPGAGPARTSWSLSGALAGAVARWRTARAIADLDDHLLRDIGMLGAARSEPRLPFGRPDLW
jgi:hypothetical protein